MKPIILKLARDDLKEIHRYLSEYGVHPPQEFRESFEKFCTQVADMPFLHSVYESNVKYRRAVLAFDHPVFYRVEETSGRVRIYRVLYGKRNISPLLE